MKNSQPAPEPDPKIGEAALLQAQTGENWLSFAKDAFAISQDRQVEIDRLSQEVGNLQLETGRTLLDQAKEDRDRYTTTFRPMEDKLVAEAESYDTPERQAAKAAEAKADVMRSSADARATAERQAAGLGIRPDSGRYDGIQRGLDRDTALLSAGAQNTARNQVQTMGRALRADAINLGRGLPSQSAQNVSQGLGAGQSGLGAYMNANAQQMASGGIMDSGFRGAMAGYAGQASTLQGQDNFRLQSWSAQQQANAANSAGLMSGIGGLLGLIFSDENAKEDKKPVKEGAALDAIENMPVEQWRYKRGLGDDQEHIGTYAQDFQRETGKGDGRSIPVGDAIGLAMGAIKDLSAKVDRLAGERRGLAMAA